MIKPRGPEGFMYVEVFGEPKPQPRPRACVRGRHAMMYDAGTADHWKWLVGKAIREAGFTLEAEKSFHVEMNFYISRPKSHYSQSKKNFGCLKSDVPLFCTKKPDCDNLAKAVLDAMTDTQCVWRDDSQVVILNISKQYGGPAGVEIKIKTI